MEHQSRVKQHQMDTSVEQGISKAELRKVNKPLMEKRRRARINACLSQLKLLVLQAMRKQGCSYSKLEKADILEMTVQYLKTIQKNQIMTAAAFDPAVMKKYSAGYTECTNEAVRYLSTMEEVDCQMKSRLLTHLAKKHDRLEPYSTADTMSSALDNTISRDMRSCEKEVTSHTLTSSACKNSEFRNVTKVADTHKSCRTVGKMEPSLENRTDFLAKFNTSLPSSPSSSSTSGSPQHSPVLSQTTYQTLFEVKPEPVWRPW